MQNWDYPTTNNNEPDLLYHFELNVDKTGLHLKATLDDKIADMMHS
jgi:hypothetical protein